MTTQKYEEFVSTHGKAESLMVLLWRLGGFVVLALVALVALWYVWQSLERRTDRLYDEMKENQELLVTVVRDNTRANAALTEAVARLTQEVRNPK